MSRYGDAVRRVGHARWFAWIASRMAPPLDRFLYRRFGGRITATGRPLFPTMLLTTTGRRTGRERTVPLLYLPEGERLVVAGSNWGRPGPPNWAENLMANPRARVRIGAEVREVLARVSTPQERERLWPKLDRLWPAYDTYRRRSGREIRVFVLEPLDGAARA